MNSNPQEKRWLAFLVVGVGIFMSTLDGSIVNVALPSIMASLAAPMTTIEWVMMIYLLTISSLLLSFGRLSDIRGRRWVYTRGLLVFAVGSLCCGLSNTAWALIASRALQGVGAAMIMACTQAIIVDVFPKQERGKALGLVGAVVASGLTTGPAIGGWILELFNWQMIFYINIPIGIATAWVAHRILGEESDRTAGTVARFDRLGALLLIFCISSFLLIFSHGYKIGYGHPAILALTVLFVASTVGFVWDQHKNPAPIFEPSLLRIRRFTLPVISAMILFASLFSLVFLMPFYLMHPSGFSARETGHLMVTPFIFLFLFAPISGALSDRIGSRGLCTLGMSVLCCAFFFLAGLLPEMGRTAVLWRLSVAGVGIAAFTAPNNAAVMSAVPRQYIGIASGMVAMVRNLGMVFGIAMSGAIFNSVFFRLSGGSVFSVYSPELEPVFMAAFQSAMNAAGILAGVGAIITYLRGPEARQVSDP